MRIWNCGMRIKSKIRIPRSAHSLSVVLLPAASSYIPRIGQLLNEMRIEKARPAVVETFEQRDAANHQLASAIVDAVNASCRRQQVDILKVCMKNGRCVRKCHQFHYLAARRAECRARATQNDVCRIGLVYDFFPFHSVGHVISRTAPKFRILQDWRFIG
jgi:hypothetical protein